MTRKISRWKSYVAFLENKAKTLFVKYLPSDSIKNLPPQYVYVVGSFLFSVIIAAFIVMLILGYNDAVGKTYLATLSGTDPSPNCDTLGLSNTGTYLATQDGNWEGQEGFQYSAATYEGTMTSYSISIEEYTSIMVSLFETMKYIGNITANNDLSINLLY
jgi:hypothetical protein